MKYLTLLLALAFLPSAMAVTETFEVEPGVITLTYPESADFEEEIVINLSINLTENSLVDVSALLPEVIEFDCSGNSCDVSYVVDMGTDPIINFLQIELQDPTNEVDNESPGEIPNFYFGTRTGEQTVYIIYFTVLPEVPETIEIVETIPRLEDEVIFLVNEKTDRELIEEDFDEAKARASSAFEVTKSAKLKAVDGEVGKEIKTVWTIKVDFKEGVLGAKDVYVYEEVPKEGAQTFNEIINANPRFTVLKEDPIIMWHFAEVDEPIEITYETSQASITGAATIVTAEDIERGTPWGVIIPIVLIPIIAGIIIFFSRFNKK
jgi:hypothetical protein